MCVCVCVCVCVCTNPNLTLHWPFNTHGMSSVSSYYECIQSRNGEEPNMLLDWTRRTLSVLFPPIPWTQETTIQYLKVGKYMHRSHVLTAPLTLDTQIPWDRRHQLFMCRSMNSSRNMTRWSSQLHQQHAVTYAPKVQNASLSNKSKSHLPFSFHFRISLLEITI
jgi:hypothetical protein